MFKDKTKQKSVKTDYKCPTDSGRKHRIGDADAGMRFHTSRLCVWPPKVVYLKVKIDNGSEGDSNKVLIQESRQLTLKTKRKAKECQLKAKLDYRSESLKTTKVDRVD